MTNKPVQASLDDQNQFVDRVVALTRLKQAEWLRDEPNTRVTYCFIDKEAFIFQLHFREVDASEISHEPDGVMCFTRNIGIFWPASMPQFVTLHSLMKQAPPNSKLCGQKRLECANHQKKLLAKIGLPKNVHTRSPHRKKL